MVPLCYTGVVYARQVKSTLLTFGVSGKLIMNGLVMYDDETDTLWSQVLGEAVRGPLNGTALEVIPSTQTTLVTWRELHPDTLVIGDRIRLVTSDDEISLRRVLRDDLRIR